VAKGEPIVPEGLGSHLRGDAPLSHSLLLGERLYLFTRLRFLAAAGILVGALFATHVVGVAGLNLPTLAGTAVLLALCNLLVFFRIRPFRSPERAKGAYRSMLRIASATILLDYAVLTFTIWQVGGTRSPFLAFYVLHAIFASVMLSRRAAVVHTSVGYVMLAVLVVGEWAGWWPRHVLAGAVLGVPEEDFRVVGTLLFVYGLLMAATTYLATGMTTRLRQKERDLREILLQAERLADLRRSFLHVVVHDLRSPVGAVTTLLDNLKSGLGGPLNTQQQRWAERADQRLQGALELLRALQVMADLETESLADLMKPVALEPIIREVVEEQVDLAQAHGQTLTAELPEILPKVRCIDRLVREALVNYVGNAIKHAGPGRSIVVRLLPQGAEVRIEVADNGPGIAPEAQKQLFQEFSRLSRSVPGTGLGLSIVRRIAEAHGGKVGVESAPGQGSRFFLILPVAES
jgi:signal transduction histidine kinase